MFVKELLNTTLTQNGAISNKSSLNACLDLFSMGVSTKYKEELIINALKEDPITAIKVVMYLRDCRRGQGNKDIARIFHKVVLTQLQEYKGFMERYYKLLPYLPEVGSWKDVYDLYGKNKILNKEIINFVQNALIFNNGLAAKWFPRQSTFHKDFAAATGRSLGEIRRLVVKLTSVVETQMCANNWHHIEYNKVPSVANKKYNKAFKRNDSSRYEEFLKTVLEGKEKVNSSQLYPHEIAYKAMRHCDIESKQANALWKNLPNFMKGNQINILPIIDTSSSMTTLVYNNYSCMHIAIGLGLYFAEYNTEDFKNLWCNFSKKPTFRKLSGDTLSDKIESLDFDDWGSSTNLQSVFDMILPITKRNPESCPKVLLIVSDMEFNRVDNNKSNFEEIKTKYAEAGLELPTIVFWRVDVKEVQQPVTIHSTGTVLINGYSPTIMKLLCSMDLKALKEITPLSLMHKAIEKYTFVDKIYE